MKWCEGEPFEEAIDLVKRRLRRLEVMCRQSIGKPEERYFRGAVDELTGALEDIESVQGCMRMRCENGRSETSSCGEEEAQPQAE